MGAENNDQVVFGKLSARLIAQSHYQTCPKKEEVNWKKQQLTQMDLFSKMNPPIKMGTFMGWKQ